jgi:dihydropteroate synthase-like protein
MEILAEINHAPRLTLTEILAAARELAAAGADVIDVGCDPGEPWDGVGECVRALRAEGLRVSIDSLNPREIEPAVRAGAELVLSVNSTNRDQAPAWGCEVVAIPDEPARLDTLDETMAVLREAGIPFRIDPILEPIGFGFAASLERYIAVRRRYPKAAMMMGVGNITELTDADSAPINLLLLAICQELQIRSVLTTQVINWARSSVRECDLARRLVFHAVKNRVPPKHLEPLLVLLRDEKVLEYGPQRLEELAAHIKDNNFRIFAERRKLHLLSGGLHLENSDPFVLFDDLLARSPGAVDASHAFYLGYEMAKAVTALTLGKNYRQDEALDWGFLTVPEESHRERKTAARRRREGERE